MSGCPSCRGSISFERLKAAGSDLPVIFITGHGDVSMMARAIEAGAADFLLKPLDEQALVAAVKQAIARRRCRQG